VKLVCITIFIVYCCTYRRLIFELSCTATELTLHQ
jgi:hypothetical protein